MGFSRGCVFVNFGTKCVNSLTVCLFSLRKYYSGPITLFLDDASYSNKLKRDLLPLDLNFERFDLSDHYRSSVKGIVFDRSPYDSALVFDSDLLFRASPEPLFDWLDEYGVLVTRFFHPPHGIEQPQSGQRFGNRVEQFEAMASLVSSSDMETGMNRLLDDRIDINVGVVGIKRPECLSFLKELLDLIERGRVEKIKLIDELATNIIIPRYRHFLADEKWNCPEDPRFRQTVLTDAKIVHYFADGSHLLGKRMGRNRETEAGKMWLEAFNECQSELTLHNWSKYDPFFMSKYSPRMLIKKIRHRILRGLKRTG